MEKNIERENLDMNRLDDSLKKGTNQYFKDGREIIVVRLVRRATADGLLEFKDDVPIGTKYIVYKEPCTMHGMHVPTGTNWARSMYETIEGGWLPTEVLEEVKL